MLGPWLVGGFWAVIALWLILSLATFHPADPTPLNPDAGPAQNLLGLAGAFTAGALYAAFGLGAWLLVLWAAGSSALNLRKSSRLAWLPWMAGALWLLLGLCGILGISQTSFRLAGAPIPLGGGAGQALAWALNDLLGQFLTVILLLVPSLAGLACLWWVISQALDLPLIPRWSPSEWLARWREAGRIPSGPEPTDEFLDEPLGEPRVDAIPPEPEPVPQPERQPEPEAPPADQVAGPVIKPRTPPPERAAPTGGQISQNGHYELPPLTLLRDPQPLDQPDQDQFLIETSRRVEQKLADFGVAGQVVEVAPGPVVTRYEFKPAPGVKISKVAGLADDLAMNLRASSIRIVAPIPGKAVIGIEIPSRSREMVMLGEILSSRAYQESRRPLTIALGKDILGQPVVDDLSRMPHLLIAGATGAGKSVFINSLVLSILYRCPPSQVRLLMVDPKRIELSTYNDIPHLLYPVITEARDATAGLRWVFAEMERRYELLVRAGVRNIESFNQRVERGDVPPQNGDQESLGPLPYIVVIIDELADLMMAGSKEVEGLIIRLAQKARAAGIHLVLATQRPSVDVITGLIKANFPARISFQVVSRVDSRTILDTQGAEHLLGKGDMLFMFPGTVGLARVHGAFVSDDEIEAVVDYVKSQQQPEYDESIVADADENGGSGLDDEDVDERYDDAVALVKQTGQASISFVQRRLRVGYNRAARMIERMEAEGIVGPSDGSRPREVLVRD
jgi:S-DNA-T family DNA segregation ATPase FtsK/SpoIIIE